jgi:hypothetical protein
MTSTVCFIHSRSVAETVLLLLLLLLPSPLPRWR